MSEIQEIRKEEKKHVSWVVFVWAMGITLLLFGFLFNQVAEASKDNNDIKIQLSQIQTDLAWIKLKLSK